MKTSLFITLLALFTVVSCGKGGGKSSSKKTTRITQEQITDIMDNQKFSCASASGGSCPKGISRLLILNKEDADQSSACSGFMVSEDTLVTNNHCVPDATACANTYIAIYTGSGYQQTKCQSIVMTKLDYADPNDPRRKLDFTILKVQTRYYGTTFKTASRNALRGDSVTAWVVDHTGLDKSSSPNLYESRITEFKCTADYDADSASLVLRKCPVIHGNSGSPAVNSAGEVVGVIWGGSLLDEDSSLPLSVRKWMPGVALVTEIDNFVNYLR